MPLPPWARDRDPHAHPSASGTGVNTTRKDIPVYTGDVVKGISLLHKQAYAPITDAVHGRTDPKRST